MGNQCACVCAQSNDVKVEETNGKIKFDTNFPNWSIDSDESIILDPVEILPKALIRRYLVIKYLRAVPLFESFLNPGRVALESPKTDPMIEKIEKSLVEFHAKRIKGATIENFCTVYLQEGGCYSGQWDISQQRPEGYGIMVYPDGSKYYGDFRSGKKSGRGRLICLDCSLYEGEFYNDKKQGLGWQKKSDGTVYKGQFLNNMEHGEGTLEYLGKTIYSGGFIRGLKHGFGKLYIDKNVYTGDFFADQIDGNGHYIWADGREYEGGWKCNKMHGFGNYKWADGKSYSGHFVEGIREGVGSFKWNDGREYKGGWAAGKMHGEGAYIYMDKGKKRNFVALYEHGKRKKVLRY